MLKGQRVSVSEFPFALGRGHGSGIILPPGDSRMVSKNHAEIRYEDGEFFLADIGSTNGTFLNGKNVTTSKLKHDDQIMLGPGGIAFVFLMHNAVASEQTVSSKKVEYFFDETLPGIDLPPDPPTRNPDREQLLSEAVDKARLARRSNKSGEHSGQTLSIMREVLDQTLQRKSKKHVRIVSTLIIFIIALLFGLILQSSRLISEKSDIDGKIVDLELQIQNIENPEILQKYIETLNELQEKAKHIEKNLLYEIGTRNAEDDFIEAEVHRILQKLGAETYSVPPDFLSEIKKHLAYFTNMERESLRRMLDNHENLESMKEIFREQNLPGDLVYMVYVESRFRSAGRSRKGAAGIWQMRTATARAYGLKVGPDIDERLDMLKSTSAAARYIKYLILDFGSGSSVMLALAAYNYGPTKLRSTIRQIPNPIQQRNFWYLYRTRALPRETREYVPKILAVMLIGRNQSKFLESQSNI